MNSPLPTLRRLRDSGVRTAKKASPIHYLGGVLRHIQPTVALNNLKKSHTDAINKGVKRVRAFVRKKTGFRI